MVIPMLMDDVDFLIIGATKSATTWLQKSLQADPLVAMPNPELHYFSRKFDRETSRISHNSRRMRGLS